MSPRTRDAAGLDGELDLPDCGKDPASPGSITNNGGSLMAQDSLGVFNVRQPAGLLDLSSLLFTSDLCIIVAGCDYVGNT